MGPRADFVCLSVKCKTDDGGAPTLELPVAATRCPVCGSKRIRRLFNSINVATKGLGKFIDPMLQPTWERQHATQEAGKEARTGRHPGVVAGHASQMGALLAKATGMPGFGAASAGPNKPGSAPGSILGAPIPVGGNPLPAANVIARRPRPAPGSPSWGERPK